MLYRVYTDESRQSKDRYMVLGGLIMPDVSIHQFNETMRKFREETMMFAELKWTKVSNQKFEQYKRFVEYFFALSNTDNLHFHCLIVDNQKVNHKKFNQGDKELGFYKFYYQLLLHCFGCQYCRPEEGDKFIIHMDKRNTAYRLDTLKTVLNSGIRKQRGITTNPFVSIEPLDSKESEIIQVNDIILGAIGFQKNGYELLANTRQAKKDLAAFIAQEAGLKNLRDDTPRNNQRFTIWNFRLQK